MPLINNLTARLRKQNTMI